MDYTQKPRFQDQYMCFFNNSNQYTEQYNQQKKSQTETLFRILSLEFQ